MVKRKYDGKKGDAVRVDFRERERWIMGTFEGEDRNNVYIARGNELGRPTCIVPYTRGEVKSIVKMGLVS